MKDAETIIKLARSTALHKRWPISGWFAGFSGGNDSLANTHWCMEHIPGCQVLHINTGIGIEKTREFVRWTCKERGWPLTEIRAKEDCGQDYRALVLKDGFPGPAFHKRMYQRLKERAVQLLVRRTKKPHSKERVVILSGLRRDESIVRMGYKNREVNEVNCQLWVNPIFWWTGQDVHIYLNKHKLERNPVSKVLGMSGECLCGAFAHEGEKAMIRQVCPATADRIEALEHEVKAAGHNWGWEESPPRCQGRTNREKKSGQVFMPFCVGCGKKDAA